jgi:hypothetical protein
METAKNEEIKPLKYSIVALEEQLRVEGFRRRITSSKLSSGKRSVDNRRELGLLLGRKKRKERRRKKRQKVPRRKEESIEGAN